MHQKHGKKAWFSCLRVKRIIAGSWKTRQTGLVMKYHLVTKVAGQAMTKNISLFLFLSPPVLRDKRIVARSWKTMMQTGLVVRGLADCCFGRMMVGPGRQGSAHKRNTRTHTHTNRYTRKLGAFRVWSVVLLIAVLAE